MDSSPTGTSSPSLPGGPALNAAQREVLDLLGAKSGDRPTFDDALRTELRHDLETALAPALARHPRDEGVFLGKYDLGQVLGCEAKFVHERDEPFAWSVPTARGAVAHKAIELSVNWRRESDPMTLVDESLARLEQGMDGLAEWLQTCGETERAELRAEANERTAKFLECFPPLKSSWRPVTESRLRAEIADRRVTLAGKVDLSLGKADGLTAGKVLVDLKTGGTSQGHVDDLRFYALIETLRLGTPPRRLASYYLDQGRATVEDVTVGTLDATVARVVAGIERIVDLDQGLREAERAPSVACRWCPALDACVEGQAHLAELDAYG